MKKNEQQRFKNNLGEINKFESGRESNMIKSQIKVLLIEDNPGDVRLIREMMSEVTHVIPEIEYVNRLNTGLKCLAEGGFNVVLLDLGLPDSKGLNTFIKVHNQAKKMPIVVLTDLDNEELGYNAVKKGAQDYLVKGKIDGNLLIRAVRYAIERKKAEEQIKASLKEKEVLLQEVHHRVKNNMQAINSLLNLQSGLIEDKKTLELFKTTQNRVKSMSLIHEKLYQSKNSAKVDFNEYVQSLTHQLINAYGIDPNAIKLHVKIEDVLLDITKAIPCGLIINELVSNSLKHAFPNGRKGEINIAMHFLNNKNEIELTVSDNGVGIPEEIDHRRTASMGLQLINILVEDQLHDEIKLDKTNGTSFHIRLKVKQKKLSKEIKCPIC